MLKKLLASMMSIIMVLTVMMALPVAAETTLPANIGTDYEPGAVTGNLITNTNPSSSAAQVNNYSNKNNAAYCVQLEGETAAMVSVEATNYQPYTGIAGSVMYTAKRTVPNPWIVYDTTGEYATVSETEHQYLYPLNGTVIQNVSYPEDMATDGNMVFSVKVNNKSNTEGAKIIAARTKTNTGETSPNHFQYPMEYPNTTDGMVVTATGNDTQLFACTFEDTASQTTKQFAYSLGLPEGTAAGTVIRAVSDLYLGLEYAYDINVTAEDTELYFGKSITMDADVVNQGNIVGGISQDVTWYAVNADRTAAVEGFTITESDNGVATISVDTEVEAGTYYIVAVSDSYADFVKGVPVTVTEKSYDDYVAGDVSLRSDNMVTPSTGSVVGNGWDSPTPTFGFNGAGGAGGMQKGPNGSDYYFKNLVEDVSTVIAGSNPVVGFNVLTTAHEGATGNVVYSIKFRANPSPKSVINVARVNTSVASTSASHVEYAEETGFTPSTNLQAYTGTFEDKGVAATKYVYRFGFVNGTEQNAIAYFNPDSVYIGYECAADIDVAADKESVFAGNDFTVNADVLNQIGETGTINQNVTWYAMNADRTEMVSGFTFTEGENGEVTVSVASEVAAGNYDIVAIADVDDELVKGVEIQVENYVDYTPDESTRYQNNMVTPSAGNIVGNGWDSPTPTFGFNGAGGTGSMQKGPNGNDYYFKNLLEDVSTAIAGSNPVVGFNVLTTAPEDATGNVVYSIKFRANASPKSVINVARVNTSVASTSASHVEYAEETGFTPSTNLQAYTGTFEDKGVAATKYVYRFGFVNGTEQNAIAYFNPDSVYIGYEYAYDIAVEADKDSIAAGETITVNADILNQIGETGAINQSVTWYALNDERTALVDGFTFTEGENGEATVSVDSEVAAGNYDLVAIADADGKLIKGVSIEVTENAQIEGITITKTASGITVATDADLTDAQLIFVTYEGGKMAAVNNATKVTLSAQDTQEYPVPAGFENAKVMLWSAGFVPLAGIIE